MSAVEWLLDWMGKNQYFIGNDLLQAVEQAKEMEKEQTIQAFNLGVYDGGGIIKKYKMSGEQYYNQTFKSE